METLQNAIFFSKIHSSSYGSFVVKLVTGNSNLIAATSVSNPYIHADD